MYHLVLEQEYYLKDKLRPQLQHNEQYKIENSQTRFRFVFILFVGVKSMITVSVVRFLSRLVS